MIYETIPEDFDPKFEVSSCFLEHDERILLLLRQPNKPEGGTFGVPAGKIESGEDPRTAISRELRQETGCVVAPEDFDYFQSVYVKYPDYDFTYYMYHLPRTEEPVIRINRREHSDFLWVLPKDALDMPLIGGLDLCIKMFYRVRV